MPALNSDYKDMLHVLLDHGVEFLLVGAYAMGAHGFPQDGWFTSTEGQSDGSMRIMLCRQCVPVPRRRQTGGREASGTEEAGEERAEGIRRTCDVLGLSVAGWRLRRRESR